MKLTVCGVKGFSLHLVPCVNRSDRITIEYDSEDEIMWYILSYKNIQGFVSGTFPDIEMLFFQAKADEEGMKWTSLISEAQGFPTEIQARAFAYKTWGVHHCYRCFMFAEFKGDRPALQLQYDEIARKSRNAFDAFTLRLANSEVEGAELVPLANNDSPRNPLTSRERWIIRAMSKSHP